MELILFVFNSVIDIIRSCHIKKSSRME